MGTHQLIYIRTDGNHRIASGHLMRCFSIAMACRQLGMDIHFLVSDRESFSLLHDIAAPKDTAYGEQTEPGSSGISQRETSFAISQLQTASYDHLEQELPEVITILSAHFSGTCASLCDTRAANRKPVYFLDSYYVTEAYLSALRPYARLIYLDDLRLFDYSVDLLINYDVIPDSEMASYKASYQNAKRLLLGAAYTPLRHQFQNRQIPIENQVKNLLLTTGGSDPFHFCLAFIQLLENPELTAFFSASGITIHIVIGSLNTDKNALYECAGNIPFLCLHEKVSDMAALMLGCDLAVSAAGTTLYELCALGIPSISFTMADNQLTAAKAFDAAGTVPWAGDLRKDLDEVLQKIILFIKNNKDSYDNRKHTQKNMKHLVDGSGAMRIAAAIKTDFSK